MRRALLPTLALAVLATASACGEDQTATGGSGATASESASPSATPSETPSETPAGSPSETATDGGEHEDQAVEIEVELEDGSVKPSGERVEVGVGEPVEFVVESDTAGSLHVHSSPEHELDFDAGTTTFPPLTFDRPGVVEVESHDPHAIVVQLEVK